jgi:hypothetical protein
MLSVGAVMQVNASSLMVNGEHVPMDAPAITLLNSEATSETLPFSRFLHGSHVASTAMQAFGWLWLERNK